MIIFKNGALHIFTLFLLLILIILWEIGEIDCRRITKRGIVDNINNGIRFAGQMFGINNSADIANLVAKALAPTERYTNDPLNTGETQFHENSKQNENEYKEPSASLNTSFMIANMLKLMGLDTAKLGAVALNIIILLAQMIGSVFKQPNPSLANQIPQDTEYISDAQAQRQGKSNINSNSNEKNEKKPSKKFKIHSAFDWILENPSEELNKILQQLRDEKLPDYFVNRVTEMESNNGDGDCIKILICKSQPIVWGMQKQVIDRIDGNIDDDDNQSRSNKTDVFYKYLPNLNEFKKHGITCEKKYPNCNF